MPEIDDVFTTYERTVVQTRRVTTVTEENIMQIAALVSGSVVYSDGQPSLSVVDDIGTWVVPLGQMVELTQTSPMLIADGHLTDEWKEVSNG